MLIDNYRFCKSLSGMAVTCTLMICHSSVMYKKARWQILLNVFSPFLCRKCQIFVIGAFSHVPYLLAFLYNLSSHYHSHLLLIDRFYVSQIILASVVCFLFRVPTGLVCIPLTMLSFLWSNIAFPLAYLNILITLLAELS